MADVFHRTHIFGSITRSRYEIYLSYTTNRDHRRDANDDDSDDDLLWLCWWWCLGVLGAGSFDLGRNTFDTPNLINTTYEYCAFSSSNGAIHLHVYTHTYEHYTIVLVSRVQTNDALLEPIYELTYRPIHMSMFTQSVISSKHSLRQSHNTYSSSTKHTQIHTADVQAKVHPVHTQTPLFLSLATEALRIGRT